MRVHRLLRARLEGGLDDSNVLILQHDLARARRYFDNVLRLCRRQQQRETYAENCEREFHGLLLSL